MKRNISALQNSQFDLLIVGGGITGACLAADAAMRGLSVALVEKGDIGSATSAASSKVLHGGIRYLQQLNFTKVYESAKERIYFQQLAPHLTYYVPFVIPTYTSFTKGKFAMRLAMALFEFICIGQNNILSDTSKRVPASHFLSPQDVKNVIPDLQSEKITGGVVFYESHMHSSERMTLGFIETAMQNGASAANYLEVEGFLGADKGSVNGVRVKDLISRESFDIQSTLVVNAAGPWIPMLNNGISQSSNSTKKVESVISAFSKGVHIVTRQLTHGHAVALPTKKQNQAIINRGGRHVFIIPWRGYSLIGTTYRPYKGELDEVCATENDINEMIGDINSALLSGLALETDSGVLHRDDVMHAFAGIYPLIDEVVNANMYQGTGKYQIIDHAETDDLDGLVSVFGAKFTTARLLAEKVLDQITPRFDKMLGRCKTRSARLVSGDIENIKVYREEQKSRYGSMLSEAVIDNLVTSYGTNINRVVELIETDKRLADELVSGMHIIAAEIVYSARHEMACHLDDFIFRRTGLGTLGNPGEAILRNCAMLMAQELEWDQNRIDQEVLKTFRHFLADR